MKSKTNRSIRVAVVQAAPSYMDLDQSVKKATALIGKAARRGARVIAFGEAWLSGYPAWIDHATDFALWDHAPSREVYLQFFESAIEIPGKTTRLLAEAAADHGVTLVIGANERVQRGRGNGSIFNTLLTFSENGKLANHHRKLVPTHAEKLVWSSGDADGLLPVETGGVRIGGMICWEHWMPFARQAMHNLGEDLHVAAWPAVNEIHQLASRQYAFEGRCYVLAAGSLMSTKDLPKQLRYRKSIISGTNKLVKNGGSMIIAPNGDVVCGPIYDEETILVADLDLTQNVRWKMTLDTSGQHARPDIFSFAVRRNTRNGNN